MFPNEDDVGYLIRTTTWFKKILAARTATGYCLTEHMTVYARQKLLLALVHGAGGSLAATDFQKLLFLYTRKWEPEPSFRFVPYRFGGVSFQSFADRKSLIDKGLLFPLERGEWKLTPKAAPYIPRELATRMKLFTTKAVKERGDALIARAYREEPYYATRSEILDRVFPGKADRKSVMDAAPDSGLQTALFTIGYEGDSIDGYLDRLLRNRVALLCDVRRNPLSRKTGFSGRQLAGYCERVGILYRHLPDLGIPTERRRELVTRADYDALFEEYEREDLPKAGHAIEQLSRLLDEHSRIALTCFEKEPECCHRHCVAEEMERKIPNCPAINHL